MGETKAASHCSRGCWKGLIDSNRSVNFSISYADSATYSLSLRAVSDSPISARLTSLGPNHCAANSTINGDTIES